MKWAIATWGLGLVAATRLIAADLHVASAGNLDGNGSPTRPFATLIQARNAARALPADASRRIIVHAGRYEDTSLLLEPADSGLIIEAAPGARPVLCGGLRITGWKAQPDGTFAAPLPSLATPPDDPSDPARIRSWQIRALEVDGRLAPRARYPETGTLEHETRFDVPWMSSTGGGWKRPPTEAELTTLTYRLGDLPASLDLTNAEITVYHMWDESCVGIASRDEATQTLRLSPPTGHPPGSFGVRKYVIWNTREGLTRPGQWYHDRTGNRVVYRPRPGEDPNRLPFYAPTQTSVVRLRGREGSPVRRLTLRGLEISTTTVPLIAAGFGANAFPGAIHLTQTEDCELVDLTVGRVAGHGIAGDQQLRHTRVARCEISECGGGGIYIGGDHAVIEDNRVHDIGLAYPSAIGIHRGGRDCVVRHNEVHGCSYSAINYGGVRCRIENNHLYDCMRVLHDGAAIYMFAARDSVIRGNYAHDIVDTGGYGASAYYLDERSTGCVVEQNLSVRVGWPSHNHMATNNVIRDNVFVVDGDAKLTFPRSSGFRLIRNVLYATGRIRIEGANAVTEWRDNLFFSGTGSMERVMLDRYSPTETLPGAPPGVLVADPQFVDRAHLDFRFGDDSPARPLGLQPLNPAQAGPRLQTP